jgi:hypothetical protein
MMTHISKVDAGAQVTPRPDTSEGEGTWVEEKKNLLVSLNSLEQQQIQVR